MPDPVVSSDELAGFLAGAGVEPAAFGLRPDYRALLLAVDGLLPAPSDDHTEALLQSAEASDRDAMRTQPVDQLPHVASWRAAYRDFGAKPQRTRNSLEALLRRVDTGLPRVNRLTDLYNSISVRHLVPVGGEDLARYAGPPVLVRATGQERFDTVVGGEPVVEYPEPGEVVWRDDEGVTCRRWNWRQARRTRLTDETTAVLFILDALDPVTDAALDAVADELLTELSRMGPDVRVARRTIARIGPPRGD